jgi:hypothetical protein
MTFYDLLNNGKAEAPLAGFVFFLEALRNADALLNDRTWNYERVI